MLHAPPTTAGLFWFYYGTKDSSDGKEEETSLVHEETCLTR